LRSSAASFSTFARISFVGSTQSIGIELQACVRQFSRAGRCHEFRQRREFGVP
jgi:hypothetical protein